MPGCGFHEWLDPPMCPRSTMIIPGLLKRINAFERTMPESVAEELHDHQPTAVKESKDLRQIKLMIWLVLFIVVVLLFK